MTSRVSKTKIIGLKPGTFYTYTLELYDKNTLVYSSAASKAKPKQITDPNTDYIWIAGVVGGLLAAALLVILIVVIVFLRRRAQGKQKESDESNDINVAQYNNGGFINESFEDEKGESREIVSPPVYAAVNKRKKGDRPAENAAGAVSAELAAGMYAEVKNPRKNAKPDQTEASTSQDSALYALVQKPERSQRKSKSGEPSDSGLYAFVKNSKKEIKPTPDTSDTYAEVKKPKKSKKKKTRKNQKSAEDDADNSYGNIGAYVPGLVENAYENVQDMRTQAPQQYDKIKGSDGTLYEDPRNFDFDNSPTKIKPKSKDKKKSKIITEDNTEYASIDFTKRP